jgi:hypothetical protein
MEILKYDESFFQEVSELIRYHHKKIPPFVEIPNDEIEWIMAHPNHFIDLHFDKIQGQYLTYVGSVQKEVIVAAQLFFLNIQNQQI